MAKDKVRIGVVGVGGMGAAHCDCAQRVEEVALAAVADIDGARAREVGEQFAVPWFRSHEELIGAGLVDAITIATPHYFHPPIAIDAFRAGLHVLSEKPIGVQISEAEKMVKAARESGKVFSVMFQRRTEPAVRKARELVEAGVLGEVRRTALISPTFRSQVYYDSGGWRATWAGEGGGVLMNQAPHNIDVFVLLGGMPRRVRGWCKTLLHQIEVEDHAEAVLEYENGATGYFYVSTCEPGPGDIIQVFGDRGKLQLVDGKLSVSVYEPSVGEFSRTNTAMWGAPQRKDLELELPQAESGHHVVMRNFARAILYGEELLSPGEEGLQSLELANAIMLSSYRGRPVDIPISRQGFDRMIKKLCACSSYKPSEATQTKRETDPRLAR